MNTTYSTLQKERVAKAKRNGRRLAIAWIFWVLFCLGIVAGFIFVIIHFIIRFWS